MILLLSIFNFTQFLYYLAYGILSGFIAQWPNSNYMYIIHSYSMLTHETTETEVGYANVAYMTYANYIALMIIQIRTYSTKDYFNMVYVTCFFTLFTHFMILLRSVLGIHDIFSIIFMIIIQFSKIFFLFLNYIDIGAAISIIYWTILFYHLFLNEGYKFIDFNVLFSFLFVFDIMIHFLKFMDRYLLKQTKTNEGIRYYVIHVIFLICFDNYLFFKLLI